MCKSSLSGGKIGMNIEVYCDESSPDLFSSSSPRARFLLIGSLWLEQEKRDLYKREIHALRNRHKIGGEFKWTKISPSRIEFYRELIAWFHSYGDALRGSYHHIRRHKRTFSEGCVRPLLLHEHPSERHEGLFFSAESRAHRLDTSHTARPLRRAVRRMG